MKRERQYEHPLRNREPEPARSENYPPLPKPVHVTDLASLRIGDPSLWSAYQDLLGALRNDMVPVEAQVALVEALPPATKREVVNKLAGLDASVLMTLKDQLQLVDSVLRRIITPEGGVNPNVDGRIDISPKEAINLSIKLTQIITRDLPKMYKVDRVQNLEKAMFKVIDETMTKEQQDQVLLLLQEYQLEDAKRAEG